MDNLDVAAALHEIADLLELQGADPFKVRAYRRGARTLELLDEPLAEIWRRGGVHLLPGIGRALTEKIHTLLSSGRLPFLAELRAAVPPGLRELTRVPGLGARSAQLLYERLHVHTLAELEQACREQRVRDLPGFGPRREEALLEAVAKARRREHIVPAYALWPLAASLVEYVRRGPGCVQVAVAGALRRMAPEAEGVVLVAAVQDPAAMQAHLAACPLLKDVAHAAGCVAGATATGRPVQVWLVEPPRFGSALIAATGSQEHLEELAQAGPLPPAQTEAEAYGALGLPVLPPELRAGRGEVAAARRDGAPVLLQTEELQGDLHSHTRWSDGLATAAEMAAGALALGHTYLAVTDHSRSLRVAGGLAPAQLTAQGREIDALNAAGLGGVTLLKGTEVDILKDGTLDLPDAVLSELDVVVASVHSHMHLDAAAMTARLERAVKNPHVDIIGHPTGRRLGYRDPYPLDLERLYALAARTGTALEINASPARLDLDGGHVRAARAHGVRFAVGADAHTPQELQGLAWGVGQARRGGLGAADVVNAWPLDRLRAWLRRPKA